MFEYLLELIYPNVCGICNQLNRNSLCEKCKLKLNKLDITNIEIYKDMYFNEHLYLFKYKDELRKLLLDYKFNDKIYLYKTFANIIINNEKACNFIKKYDFIISVPLHRNKFNIRGYNQCQLILKEINKYIKEIEIRNNILIKVKNNLSQSTLNKEQRMENIKNVYTIKNKELVKSKKILIFDDIFTTGNTVNECSRILKENGAGEIGIFTIAKD